jgi:uncharacterized small protein (DUF1192 family)
MAVMIAGIGMAAPGGTRDPARAGRADQRRALPVPARAAMMAPGTSVRSGDAAKAREATMPFIEEEPQRKKPAAHTVGDDLSRLSEDELAQRIMILREEIARIEAALGAKKASRTAAASFFRT